MENNNKNASSSSKTLDDPRLPSQVYSEPWIFQKGSNYHCQQNQIMGKWLVFEKAHDVDAVWHRVARALDDLGAPLAKVATAASNSQQKVLCVYTTATNANVVGERLARLLRRDVHYKTNAATEQGRYAGSQHNKTDPKITSRSMYWNNGRPSAAKTPPLPTASRNQKAVNAVKQPSLSHKFDDRIVTVVGMQHHNRNAAPYDDTTEFALEREPTNQFDPNAICVMDMNTVQQVGYIVGKQAKVLAPWLDRQLVQIQRGTLLHQVSDKTMTLRVRGRACPEAMAMLECF